MRSIILQMTAVIAWAGLCTYMFEGLATIAFASIGAIIISYIGDGLEDKNDERTA